MIYTTHYHGPSADDIRRGVAAGIQTDRLNRRQAILDKLHSLEPNYEQIKQAIANRIYRENGCGNVYDGTVFSSTNQRDELDLIIEHEARAEFQRRLSATADRRKRLEDRLFDLDNGSI